MPESHPNVAKAAALETGRGRSPVVALVGNPNTGKTTLFNAMTGLTQKVANYAGVTVEKKEGHCFDQHGRRLQILDLPGAYSLNARTPDEAILRDVLLGRRDDTPQPDRVICIVDASNLERHLYLTTQVLELGIPTIVVLNMTDIAEAHGMVISAPQLQKQLGVAVIPMQANARKGMAHLRVALSQPDLPKGTLNGNSPSSMREALAKAHRIMAGSEAHLDSRPLVGTVSLICSREQTGARSCNDQPAIDKAREFMDRECPGWEEKLVSSRYESIAKLTRESTTRGRNGRPTATDKLDRVLLHPVLGWLVLVGLMTALFTLIFSAADIPMGWIEGSFGWIADLIKNQMPSGDLRDLLTDGVLAGVGSVVVFLPQILFLFFFIGLMEDTGYMARVAFIMDRLMGCVGLSGRAFIPLLSSYACAIPGIMATRTIENPRERLITILVAPLASCSARLPVYLMMIGVLLPSDNGILWTKVAFMMGLYALGTVGMFLFAWIFHRKVQSGDRSTMILELPPYKLPAIRAVLIQMWERARVFIRQAGTVILGISILLWASTSYPKLETGDNTDQLTHSFAGRLGKQIEPVIEPLGYDWKLGIGLIASFAAREVFVSTMSILYRADDPEDEGTLPLRTILRKQTRPDGNPMFDNKTCLSLLVFYVFAMQCMSTLAVTRRETNSWKWPFFQASYLTGTAYLAALLVYQGASFLGL